MLNEKTLSRKIRKLIRIKTAIMKTNDTGSKKFNNEQTMNEGFSGENIPGDYNPSQMKPETEIDTKGNHKIVQRARNNDEISDNDSPTSSAQWNDNENLRHGISASDAAKKMEHKDNNWDSRSPYEQPRNPENHGNINSEE